MTKTVALHTLGCKLNYSETSAMGHLLEKEGYQTKTFNEVADYYVINTCAVTHAAEKEAQYIIRKIQRQAPEAMIVVTGCYAQIKPGEVAEIPGVDLVLGAAEKFKITQHIKTLEKGVTDKIHSCEIDDVVGFHSSFSFGSRTRTFLKVQEGCDYKCSYCTIPKARGRSRSQSIEKVLQDITAIKEKGVKEIVFTGVNLGDFGRDGQGNKTNEDFYELLKAVDHFDGVDRYRISSCEPNLLTDEIIDLVASSKKIMPHFHIPLQSGSNKILGLMRRRYQRELYAEKVDRIKRLIPDCGIGVDVIVGFPGETEEDFQETYNFLNGLDVTYFHVFTFSERDDTAAADIKPVIPIEIRHERNKRLRTLSYRKMEHFKRQNEGLTRKVLFEHAHKNGKMDGYTDNYIKVSIPYNEQLNNTIAEVTL